MRHIIMITRNPNAADTTTTTIAASTKVEFLAAILTAWEPLLEDKEAAETTTS